MGYEDALKAHNRRVVNPRMVYHTPSYYRVRSVARGITKLLVNLFWVVLLGGIIVGLWFCAATLGQILVEVTK
jgi:hypothetical protein